MLIRRLTIEDESFLWKALYHAIHVPDGQAPPALEIVHEPELARYVRHWLKRPDDLGFAAEEEGVLIGAAWLRRWSDQERGYGFIDTATPELSMSMLPAYRGHGVGTRLLRRLLSEAAKIHTAVSLSVSVSNPARRLYEREGFAPIGASLGSSITMVKSFPGPAPRRRSAQAHQL